MASLLAELQSAKDALEEWKKGLPVYYEPIVVPVTNPQREDKQEMMDSYPYDVRLDYFTSMLSWCRRLLQALLVIL